MLLSIIQSNLFAPVVRGPKNRGRGKETGEEMFTLNEGSGWEGQEVAHEMNPVILPVVSLPD